MTQLPAAQLRVSQGEFLPCLTSILLFDADAELRESRKLLLRSLDSAVLAIGMYSEVSRLPSDSNIGLVVIAIGSEKRGVVRVAQYARRVWPNARILALGQAFEVLDDSMYDESVMPSFNPAGVIAVARRLLRG